MARNQLREFFREKKAKARPADTNWQKKRNAWIKAVNQLYARIEDDYLAGARTDVEISRADKVVTEPDVGEYHIPELILRVAEERVAFSPKGINVFGAKGRIDVEGDRGEASIIWQPGDRWSIVASRAPTLRLVPLTANSLEEMLRGIMRP